MWDLDYKEGWVLKNWYFWTVVLKTLESPLGSKIKSINPKGNQPWIFTGRTDVEAEAPALWSPDAESQHIGKDPYAGKDWGQEEKGATEDEMVVWHYWLNALSLNKLWGIVKDREAWCVAVHGLQSVRHNWVTELNWNSLHARLETRNLCSFYGQNYVWMS